MLRDNYKKAFSQINPSEETIERIFEMTEKKRLKRIHKGLIIAVALIAVLLCGSLTANAATDGALFEGISLVMSGEKVDWKDYISNYKSYVADDGAKVEKYEFDLDGDGNGDSVKLEVKTYGDHREAMLIEFGISIEGEDGEETEYPLDIIMELAEKIIFGSHEEYSTDKTVTDIP